MLRRDKELITLPLAGLVLALIVGGITLGLVAATGGFNDGAEEGLGGLHYLLFAVGGIAIAAITQFFAGAVVAGAIERMNGGDPTVGSAIGGASRRLPALLGWGAMDWTVGTVLRTIREEFGLIGRILAGLLDFAWAAVSFLVLPVIIVEGLGPVAALRRSTEMLRQTWGENVLAQFGFGIIGIVAAIPGIILGVALISVLPALGIAVLVAWVVGIICVMSALTSVFKAALYQYATSGQTDPVFGNDVADAFRVR
ncbi:MAG: DUF6159 family protein [Actinomycetota bacterium]